MNEHQIKSFWSKVDMLSDVKSCWKWRGAKKPSGYGNVRINGKYLLAHRVAFQLAVGEIPSGFIVCHICDEPGCCNPNHLMLGTVKSNAADMVLKNRQKKPEYAAKGETNGNSKLTEKEVKEIRKLYEFGVLNQYELAKNYGVTQPAIGCIVRKKTWRHINEQ